MSLGGMTRWVLLGAVCIALAGCSGGTGGLGDVSHQSVSTPAVATVAPAPVRMTHAAYCQTVLTVQVAAVKELRDGLSTDAQQVIDVLTQDKAKDPPDVEPLVDAEVAALRPALTGGQPDWDAYDAAGTKLTALCAQYR